MQGIDRDILEYILWIPKGKVMTYKTLADVFWVHPRKVAMVMKYNRSPEYFPCYKIISHSWKVGGYNSGEWERTKTQLLQADWIEVIDGKIDKKFII